MLQPWPHGVIAVPMRRIDASLIALSTRVSWRNEPDLEDAWSLTIGAALALALLNGRHNGYAML
jgi:hypothetical protein